MWPWGHAAVGYLCWSLWLRARHGRVPAAAPVLGLAVGTQFPDLVDKPLGWTLGVLPSGRAGAHSLLIAVPLLALLWWRVRGVTGRRVLVGFALGYLTHLAGDGLYPLLASEFAELSFLLWPAVALPAYEESAGIVAHFAAADITVTLVAEVGLFALATVLWAADGAPGLVAIGQWCRRRAAGAKTALPGR